MRAGSMACFLFQYIRVTDNLKNVENVFALLNDYWHVRQPKLIISVTGGAKRFYLKNRLKASFIRGLISAATSTGICLL